MPVIYLVRHGQASFGAADYDELSATGREQAAVVGAEIARRNPRDPLVCCGTLARQRDTADLLMRVAGLNGLPRQDARWNEYDHLDLVKRYAADHAAPQGDPRVFQQLLDRALHAWINDNASGGWAVFSGGALAALDELTALLEPGQDAIVVTSGGVLAALCGALVGASPSGVIALNRVAVNGAITTLVVGSAGTSLLSFNDHAHFTGDRRGMLTYR